MAQILTRGVYGHPKVSMIYRTAVRTEKISLHEHLEPMEAVIHTSSEDWANIFPWELFRWNRLGMLPVEKLFKTFFDLFSSRNRAILERDTIFENDLCLKIVSFLEENKSKILLDIYFTGSRPMRFQRNNSHAKIFAQSSELVWITFGTRYRPK